MNQPGSHEGRWILPNTETVIGGRPEFVRPIMLVGQAAAVGFDRFQLVVDDGRTSAVGGGILDITTYAVAAKRQPGDFVSAKGIECAGQHKAVAHRAIGSVETVDRGTAGIDRDVT